MNGIIMDGILLQSLIDLSFQGGKAELLARWHPSGGGLHPTTLNRWINGNLPQSGEDLLKLAGLLDVDPFALLTFDGSDVPTIIRRLLFSAQNKRWGRFPFFHDFYNRPAVWPPDDLALTYFGRPWFRRTFVHDASKRTNYYACVQLQSSSSALSSVKPQTFHFAFRQQGRFADLWLQYGSIFRSDHLGRLFHINGDNQRLLYEGSDAATVFDTFFGPSDTEFCVISLHPFSLSMLDSWDGALLRFPA